MFNMGNLDETGRSDLYSHIGTFYQGNIHNPDRGCGNGRHSLLQRYLDPGENDTRDTDQEQVSQDVEGANDASKRLLRTHVSLTDNLAMKFNGDLAAPSLRT